MLGRVFWSLYFVFCIGVIGFLYAYCVSLFLYILSSLLFFVPRVSRGILHFADLMQCYVIRFLLWIQPWLKLKTNFPPIHVFFKEWGTRRVIFVANHRSNLDTFILISLIPGLRGLAKKSLFQNVFFAPIMLLWGFIPVDKGSMKSFIVGLEKIKTKLLMKNRSVLFFPENTRCNKGDLSVHKFNASIFATAIQAEALVVPIVIKGTDDVLGRGDLFLHPFHPIEFKLLDPVPAKTYSDALDLRNEIWDRVEKEYSC